MKKGFNKVLFYEKEHTSCANYHISIREGLRYSEFSASNQLYNDQANTNIILFVLDGSYQVDCGQYGVKKVKQHQMFYIPKEYPVTIKCLTDSRLVIGAFDEVNKENDLFVYESLSFLTNDSHFRLEPLQIDPTMLLFLDMVVFYVKNKLCCAYLTAAKIDELLMCFRFFYPKKDLSQFFIPIVDPHNFKSQVFKIGSQANNVGDLIERSNMSKTVFYERFKEQFGDVTPKNWLDQLKSDKILSVASRPAINVKQLAHEVGFDSVQQLQQYCKRYYGCTPSELIKRCKEKLY